VSPTRIHHINFVVNDLVEATERFQNILRLEPFEFIDHAPRGARIARTRLGDAWFVLVCPDDPESVPGRFLAAHGEGFFLISVGTDDLEAHLQQLDSVGESLIDPVPRDGILDWRVAEVGEVHGVLLQLTQDKAGSES
jgi:methylmalonyl-CoA/ethylmalonyl-CoA epimerase